MCIRDSGGLLYSYNPTTNTFKYELSNLLLSIADLSVVYNCLLYTSSLIMGSMEPIRVDTNRYAMFIQNFKGELVTGMTNSRKVLDAVLNKETVQRLLFCQGEKDIFVYYVYDDTLFRLSLIHI